MNCSISEAWVKKSPCISNCSTLLTPCRLPGRSKVAEGLQVRVLKNALAGLSQGQTAGVQSQTTSDLKSTK